MPGIRDAIASALKKAILDTPFRHYVAACENPFHRDNAAQCIAEGIAEALRLPRRKLMLKSTVEGNPDRIGGLKRVPDYAWPE